ncbi:MAG: hypothetical protein AB2374_10850 [Cytobacillus gottheilii]|uniref:hypothetical protein n=2 Tax=Cytobacillus gottheilii TaxID=859144 RepID=UPI000832DE97|nr:hypothetical protein [Cytobacillus gottheilii]
MKGILFRSMEERKPVEIIYMSKNNTFTQRKIFIKELKGSSILAYCLTRKQLRIFNLNNIMSILPEKPSRQIS